MKQTQHSTAGSAPRTVMIIYGMPGTTLGVGCPQ